MIGVWLVADLKDWQIRFPLVRIESASITMTSGCSFSNLFKAAFPLGTLITRKPFFVNPPTNEVRSALFPSITKILPDNYTTTYSYD